MAIVEKPVLLSENLNLRVVELVATRDFSAAGNILDEYLREDGQMYPQHRECTHHVRKVVLHLVASGGRFN